MSVLWWSIPSAHTSTGLSTSGPTPPGLDSGSGAEWREGMEGRSGGVGFGAPVEGDDAHVHSTVADLFQARGPE